MICTNSLRWLFTVLSLYGLYAKYFFLVSFRVVETLFTWSGGPRFSGVSFFCFVSPRA